MMDSDSEDSFELSSDIGNAGDNGGTTPYSLTRSQALNLYVSHAFSTWNARGYEFAAILFTAAAYPDTLVAAALRMIIVYFAMILFSSSVGHWVQHSSNRLRTLLLTIICNRGSVILGSFFWILVLSQEDLVGREASFVLPKNTVLKGFGFAVAVSFGIIERLSSSGNLISMERDWVVTVAAPAGRPYDLTHLNAVMRRIDLVCKLISPILIAAVISVLGSIRLGVVFTGLTSLVCIPIEVFSAKRVWNSSPLLQAPRAAPPSQPAAIQTVSRSWLAKTRQYFHGFETYFSTTVWVPSVALALLHFNMLTWRATFITYLINVGYSLNTITVARGIGSLFEITSTVITPRGIGYMGKAHHHANSSSVDEDDEAGVGLIDGDHRGDRHIETLIGLQRFGLWGMSWQLINTFPVVLALWAISTQRNETEGLSSSMFTRRVISEQASPNVGWSIILFSFLAFSRLGVWVFDLTTQQLTQTLVSQHQRSSFAGTENSVVNIFELLGAGAAIAFPRTEQYRWLALASLVTVIVSWIMYALWVRQQRGHLVHWEKLARGFCSNGRNW
ncbi:Ferroporti-1 [Annulohypoxylon bovei var. microspora]|nr:Ferroporti-1 [Annulohypoxylon bovei var. microspora]